MTGSTPGPQPLDQPAEHRPAGRLPAWLGRWPTLAGVGVAGFVALDLSARGLAAVLTGAALVYLAAAALKNPATAWPAFGAAVLVILAAERLLAESAVIWVLFGLAVLVVVYGLLRGAAQPADGLPRQAVAMVGYGITAAAAVLLGGDSGAYVIAAGLLGHVAWDVYHYRTNKVVARSLAEFCIALDTLLALAIVAVALRS